MKISTGAASRFANPSARESSTYSITDASVSGATVRDAHAELNKVQYRFKVIAPKGQAFRIEYEIWTQYEGEEATNSPAFITGIGTGSWAYYPEQPLELLPPYKQNTVDGCPDYVGGTKSIRTLCGGTTGGTCGMSCTASPGGVSAALSDYGLSVSMNLGSGNFGDESGSLLLAGSAPTNTLTTPAGLGLAGSLQNLEIFRSGDDLRQVKAPQVLADIVTLSSTSYEVRFYTNAGSIGGAGLYEPVGSPFSVAKVEQITSTNHIRLTVSNGSTHVYDYEWSAADGGWMLTSGGGIARKRWVGMKPP